MRIDPPIDPFVAFELVRLGPEDAAVLAALHRKTSPEDPWEPAAMHDFLVSPLVDAIAARRGCDIVGFSLARTVADEAEILAIGTEPDMRRIGIGGSLLHATLAITAARGARRLVLEVAEGNGPARRLYARFGFVLVGHRARYYADGQNALILARSFVE